MQALTVTALAAILSLCLPGRAQNLIKNGNFSTGAYLPQWTLSSPKSINPLVTRKNTNGVRPNDFAFGISPGSQWNVLSQSFSVSANTAVDFSADFMDTWLMNATNGGSTIEVWIDRAISARHVFPAKGILGKVHRERICFRWRTATKGTHGLQIWFRGRLDPTPFKATHRFSMDNIELRTVTGPLPCLRGERRIPSTTPLTFKLSGRPNSVFAVYVSLGPLAPISIPPWAGKWQLQLSSMVLFVSGSHGNGGFREGNFQVPSVAALQGVPLFWQGAEFIAPAQNMTFGHPYLMGFYK